MIPASRNFLQYGQFICVRDHSNFRNRSLVAVQRHLSWWKTYRGPLTRTLRQTSSEGKRLQLTDSTGQCPCSKQDFTETPVPCSPDHYPRVRKRGLSGTPLPSDSRVTIDCPWHRNESMTLLPPGQTDRERERGRAAGKQLPQEE